MQEHQYSLKIHRPSIYDKNSYRLKTFNKTRFGGIVKKSNPDATILCVR